MIWLHSANRSGASPVNVSAFALSRGHRLSTAAPTAACAGVAATDFNVGVGASTVTSTEAVLIAPVASATLTVTVDVPFASARVALTCPFSDGTAVELTDHR